MTKQTATSGQPKYALGQWTHLFGVGSRETHCRLVIDLEQSKLVAAQEWTGLKFEDVLGDRFKDLAESVIEVNEAHASPDEWEFDKVHSIPTWASQVAATGQCVMRPLETTVEGEAAANAALTKIDAAFESVNSLLDASGALASEPLLKAVYQLRLEIARASGDPERTKAAQISLQELSA